jgi:hypothetical protein
MTYRKHTASEEQLFSAYLAASFAAQDFELAHPLEERTNAEHIQLASLQQKADQADRKYTAAIFGEYQAAELARVAA